MSPYTKKAARWRQKYNMHRATATGDLSYRQFHECLRRNPAKFGIEGNEKTPSLSTLCRYFQRVKERKLFTSESVVENRHFRICGHDVPESLVKCLESDFGMVNNGMCYTCQAIEKVVDDYKHKNKAVLDRLNSVKSTRTLQWPDNVTRLSAGCLRTYIDVPAWLETGAEFQTFCAEEVRVRRLHIEGPKETFHWRMSAQGGRHPKTCDFRYDKGQTLKNPSDGTFGLVTWDAIGVNNTKQLDFAMIGSLGLENGDVVDICRNECNKILDMESQKRFGAAGGMTIPHHSNIHDNLSLATCDAARGHRQYVNVAMKRATNAPCVYINIYSGRLVKLGSNQCDVLMARLSKNGKRLQMRREGSQVRKTLLEMRSRVKALLVTRHFGLDGCLTPTDKGIFDSLRETLQRLESWNLRKNWINVGRSLGIVLGMWDVVLLEYACGTGEMRNHQALYAHVDGNKSHFVESMTLFGKVSRDETATDTTIVQENLVRGRLGLIWHGFCLEMAPGRDVVHLQLSRTLHAADPTRNSENWTSVHGP